MFPHQVSQHEQPLLQVSLKMEKFYFKPKELFKTQRNLWSPLDHKLPYLEPVLHTFKNPSVPIRAHCFTSCIPLYTHKISSVYIRIQCYRVFGNERYKSFCLLHRRNRRPKTRGKCKYI